MALRQAGLSDVRQGRQSSRLKLLAPLRYLAIYHPEKTFYDFKLPLVVGSIAFGAFWAIEPNVILFGDNGLLKITRELLIMAVPFMVGALATVAMSGPGQHMDRRPVGLELWLDDTVLTLRQFVCYQLGYMCFLGIFTLIAVVGAELLKPAIEAALAEAPAWRRGVWLCGSFALSQMLANLTITVLWSLYFMTDVLNRRAGSD